MLNHAIALIATLLLGSPSQPEPPAPQRTASDCTYDQQAALALAPRQFGQTPGSGWRSLADHAGCEGAAADLILQYRTVNERQVAPQQMRSLIWHEGQLRAASGAYEQAIALFERARPPSDQDIDGRNIYIDATIAFVRGDLAALLNARERLSQVPMPPGFAEAAAAQASRTGRNLSWPLNLDVVDGLIACLGRPYSEAYLLECRPGR